MASLKSGHKYFVLYFLVYFDVFGLSSFLPFTENRAQLLSIVAVVGLVAVFAYENFYLCPYKVRRADCQAMKKKFNDPFHVYSFSEKKEVPKNWSLRVLVPLSLVVSFISVVSIWEVAFCPWVGCEGSYEPSVFAVFLTILFPSFFCRGCRVLCRCLH